MTRIEYSTDEQLQQMHAEALHVLHNLRFWTKRWDEHYGHEARTRKQYWQGKADELLNKFGFDTSKYMKESSNIKIENV
jgi:CRISPR/Cas system-associated endonuclease Cas1